VTLSDERMINELKKGRETLLADTSASALLSVLRRRLQSATGNMYVLDWIPEQFDDLYDVLVDGVSVVHIEISRGSATEDVFQMWPVEEYLGMVRKVLTKPARRKLELALQLAKAEGQ
jgi:hypothetical protein